MSLREHQEEFVFAEFVKAGAPAHPHAPDSSNATTPGVSTEEEVKPAILGTSKENRKETTLVDESKGCEDAQPKRDKKVVAAPSIGSGNAPAEEAPIPNAFTYCVRSILYSKIMSETVAMKLSDMALSSWTP